jgi:hypothetical protein
MARRRACVLERDQSFAGAQLPDQAAGICPAARHGLLVTSETVIDDRANIANAGRYCWDPIRGARNEQSDLA